MTGEADKPFADQEGTASAFESRISSWDAFVIYAVDPLRSPSAMPDQAGPQNGPGNLERPFNALPIPPAGELLPIYYNQPVILQCVSSGVMSPIMIIRKVDHGSTALGGGPVDPSSASRPLRSALGETLGEPVSQ